MMTWAYFIKFVFLIYILFFSKKKHDVIEQKE